MSKLQEILKETSELDERYIKISMDLAAQISYYLKEKEWYQSDLAKRLNKKESEISKWLSGTHNFTVKTLALIESILQKDLLIIPLDINKHLKNEFHQAEDYTKTTVLSFQEVLSLLNSFGYEINPQLNSFSGAETTSEKSSTKNYHLNDKNIVTYNFS